jgi:hypothetical protein
MSDKFLTANNARVSWRKRTIGGCDAGCEIEERIARIEASRR